MGDIATPTSTFMDSRANGDLVQIQTIFYAGKEISFESFPLVVGL